VFMSQISMTVLLEVVAILTLSFLTPCFLLSHCDGVQTSQVGSILVTFKMCI
jgi:hypothetical protein